MRREPRASSLLEARGLSKTFGVVRVLDGVDISVSAGEVRGLVGQNGSGKSTLIKLITGVYEADPGAAIAVNGAPVEMDAFASGTSIGLGVMHQDLGLEPSLSIADNFIVTGSTSPLRRIRWSSEWSRIRRVLEGYGLHVDVRRPVIELTRTERAVVAMARAFDRLDDGVGVVVLDEPTAALEQDSAEALFRAVRAARARGCGVMYVSHDLTEILELCDTVTILRDGKLVAAGDVADFTEPQIIRAIVGSEIVDLYPPRAPTRETATVLAATDLCGQLVNELTLTLHEGEILGVTGLAGMGQDELAGLLYGAAPLKSGRVELFGQGVQPSPRRSMRRGVVLLPADRKGLGGDPNATLEENLTLPIAGRYFSHGFRQRARATQEVHETLVEFDVRPPDPGRLLGELSGGNQQKALLAKWLRLFGNARLLILHEPTQGVDVGARHEIFKMIQRSVDAGCSVLYVSTEYEDLAHLCDRVIVLRNGRSVAEIGKDHLTASTIASVALLSA